MSVLKALVGALAGWDDLCWAARHTRRCLRHLAPDMHEPCGALDNWPRFRKFLLGIHNWREKFETSPFADVMNDFLMPPETGVTIFKGLIPAAIAYWSVHRRVYRVSKSLVTRLMSDTSTNSIRWRDVPLPFPSFAISLEEGLPAPDSPTTTIVVFPYRDPAFGTLSMVSAFSDECASYQPIPFERRRRIDSLPLPRRMKLIAQQVAEAAAQVSSKVYGHTIIAMPERRAVDRSFVTWMLSRIFMKGFNVQRTLPRFVANFCLYLESCASSGSHVGDWEGPANPNLRDVNAIFESAQIMDVKNVTVVPKVRPAPRTEAPAPPEKKRDVCWHFRKDHKRRPAGSAPDAPKTIPVRRSEIRKDRRPPNALPGGSEGHVG